MLLAFDNLFSSMYIEAIYPNNIGSSFSIFKASVVY
jgi:hypothetical protein